ncbi:MAG: DUF5989 family protein [Syntrophales bacterium]|nr:DUF5989 family protein [Syntrophales bacterium]
MATLKKFDRLSSSDSAGNPAGGLPAAYRKARTGFLQDLWCFMRVRKKYWLLPILTALFLFGGMVVFTSGSAIAPFIYTLF